MSTSFDHTMRAIALLESATNELDQCTAIQFRGRCLAALMSHMYSGSKMTARAVREQVIKDFISSETVSRVVSSSSFSGPTGEDQIGPATRADARRAHKSWVSAIDVKCSLFRVGAALSGLRAEGKIHGQEFEDMSGETRWRYWITRGKAGRTGHPSPSPQKKGVSVRVKAGNVDPPDADRLAMLRELLVPYGVERYIPAADGGAQ